MYGEGCVTDQTFQKWFVKFCTGDFSLDNAPWSARPVELDRDSNWEQSMLYQMGDSWQTQNIPINEVIGENEKCIFYFTEKTKWSFWPTEYFIRAVSNCKMLTIS